MTKSHRYLLPMLLWALLLCCSLDARSYVVDSTWRDGVTLKRSNNNYIDIPTAPLVYGVASRTFECWTKASSQGNGDDNYNYLIAYGSAVASQAFFVRLYQGNIGIGFHAPVYVHSLSGIWSDSEWNHVAVTYGSEGYAVIINGIPRFAGAAPNINTTAGFARIGYYNSGTAYMTGQIKNLRVWSTVRTQQEIQANASARLRGDEPGLLYYAPMDDGLNADPASSTVPNANPKVRDLVSCKTYPAFTGRYGAVKSLLHDGTNDLSVATLSALATYPLTFCSWVIPPASLANNKSVVVSLGSGTSTTDCVALEIDRVDPNLIFSGQSKSSATTRTDAINNPYPLGVPVHMTYVMLSPTSRILYLNAVPVVTGTLAQVMPSCGSVAWGGIYRPSTLFYAGTFHNTGLWSRALTPQEIQQQMYMDSPVSYTGLLGYWKMDEGTGNCADSSGNGNTAVVTGATWSVLPNSNGSITNTSTSWQRTLINAFPPSFRSFLVTPR